MKRQKDARCSEYTLIPLRAIPFIRSASILRQTDFAVPLRNFDSENHDFRLHQQFGTYTIRDTQYPISPGDVTIIPPKTETEFRFESSGTMFHIRFSFPSIDDSSLGNLPMHTGLGSWVAMLHDKCEETIALSAWSNDKEAETAAALTVHQMLLWLVIHGTDTHARDASLHVLKGVERVIGYIEQHLTEYLSVSQLARIAELNQRTLSEAFRTQTSLSIPVYIRRRRIDLAKEYLIATDLPVNHIARSVGIPDPHRFTRLFRTETGITPSAFRSKKSPRL